VLNRPRVLAVAALATGVIGSYLWLSSGNSTHKNKHSAAVAAVVPQSALRQALKFVPASAAYVVVVQTNPGSAAVRSALLLSSRFSGADEILRAAEGLLRTRTGLDISTDLTTMLGNPVVIAGDSPAHATVSWVAASPDALQSVVTAATDSGDLQSAGTYRNAQLYSGFGGSALAITGAAVVAGPSPAVVRTALDRAARGTGSLTEASFDKRAAGVPKSALVRAIASGAGMQSLISRLYGPAREVPFVSALSGGALALSAAADGLHGTLRIDTAPGVLTAADMPLATGASPPVMNGSSPITVSIRDPAHLGHFLLDAGSATNASLVKSYNEIDGLLTKFARIDLDQQILSTLTGPATLTSSDLHTFNLRAQTTDPSGVSDVLSRIASIGRVGGFLGVDLGGYSVTSTDAGLVTILSDGNPVITLGVVDDVFVASTDQHADFDAIAAAPERDDGAPPARGALRAHIAPKVLLDLLVDDLGLPESTRSLLEPVGQALVTAHVLTDAITAQLFIPIK
jgi:hypothetical protein